MNNVILETVKSDKSGAELNFLSSSHAIDTFALMLNLEPSANGRAALQQPILVMLQEEEASWLASVEKLVRSSARMLIAIDEDWLEVHFYDDHRSNAPMATAYDIVDGEFTCKRGMLHHSRSGVARLVAQDLSEAYAVLRDGSGCWEELDLQFAMLAHIGIERAGQCWFWEHDARTTKDLVAVMREMEMEERIGIIGPLPGVVLNLGRR